MESRIRKSWSSTPRWGAVFGAALGAVALTALAAAPVALASTTPTITTQLSASSIVLNYPVASPQQVTDTITVTGEPDVTGYNVYVHVYPESGTPPTPSTTSIVTWEIPLNSNGMATTPAFIPESAGPFCFEANFKGDAKDTPVSTTDCEVVTVTKFPASLTTVPTSAAAAGLGTTLSDTADLSIYPVKPAEGGSGDYGTVTFALYSDPACADAVPGGVTSPAAIAYASGGFQATGSLTFATALASGTYYWIASYSGNYDNLAYTSTCGEPVVVGGSGTLGASTPTLSTQLSASKISTGGLAHDTATLSGATSTAGGTVTYDVFSNPSCTGTPESAGTVTVTNGVVPDSQALSFATAGTDYWQASYSGDSANGPAVSPCGSEVLTVSTPASGTLAASTGTPVTGAELLGPSGLAGAVMVIAGSLLLLLAFRRRRSAAGA
ncbi:MAG TPA: hypothetical protein VI138_03540 [Candidatus Dormibacteraeota bacterium]